MKITFEVPDGFMACGLTVVFFKSKGVAEVFSIAKSKDDFKNGCVKCYPINYKQEMPNE